MRNERVNFMQLEQFLTSYDQAARTLLKQCPLKTVAKGQILMRPGEHCGGYPLILEGSIRLTLLGENGREIVLYRILPGESCILSTSCLFTDELFPAEAIADADTVILMVPLSTFQQLLDVSASFRQQVFVGFTERLSQIMAVVDQLAFVGVEKRLKDYLRAQAKAGGIQVTHEVIANELGTAREVVSRYLKRFEKQGLVRLSRGSIELLDLKL
jgi:CRP/FNR family transcriptional regulator